MNLQLPNDDALIKRALSALCHPQDKGPAFWSVVGMIFGLGSTSATELCRVCGFDPDTPVKDVVFVGVAEEAEEELEDDDD